MAATQGWVTGAIPAFLLLTGRWTQLNTVVAVALVVVAVGLALAYPRFVRSQRSEVVAHA